MAQDKKLASVIVGLICVAIVISGIFVSTNSSVFDIPVVKLVIGVFDTDEYYESLEEFDDIVDDISDEEREEFYDVTGVELDEFEEMIATPSINNMLELCDIFDRVDEDEFDIDRFDLDDFDVADELRSVFSIIRTVIIAYGLFVALFSLLGALLKKRVFGILAIIFSVGFFFALVSVIMGIIFIALTIVHLVMLGRANKASATPNNTTLNI